MQNASSDFSLLYVHDYVLGPGDAGSSRAWETLQLLRIAGVDARALTSGYNPLTRGPIVDPTFQSGPPVEIYNALPPLGGRLARFAALAGNTALILPRLLAAARTTDLLYFSTPPLPGGLAVLLTHWLTGTPYVVEIRDLWPAAGAPLGIFRKNSLPEKIFSLLERLLLSQARGVIALTRGIADHLHRVYPGLPVATVPNGISLQRIDATNPRQRFRQRPVKMAYFGNLTAASDPLFAARLAGLLSKEVELHVAGDGRMQQEFVTAAKQAGARLIMHGAISHQSLPAFLYEMDFSLVPVLPDPFFRCVVSNKLLESMAASLPVLFVGDGESADIVNASRGGIVVSRGEGELERCAEAFARMLADPVHASEMGEKGRAFLRRNYSREAQTQRLYMKLREWR